MDAIHKQTDQAVSPVSSVQHSLSPQLSQKDNHSELYSQKMIKYNKFSQQALKRMNKYIQIEKEINFQQSFAEKIKLKIDKETINKEIVVLKAQWGYFSMKIKILNIDGMNSKHIQQKNRGMYGNIHCGQFNENKFVMKCIPIQFKNSRFIAIKQWFLMKITSLAGIGPKIEPYFGFDILMFSQCIQFAMEQCLPVTAKNLIIDHLYENLALLHKMHIVHQDIKPQNLMFSPKFNRIIFIDFGLSTIISEQVGTKTLSDYVGSINYWSPQMAKSFFQKKQVMMDLYYNDLHCLQKTIEQYKNIKASISEMEDFFSQIMGQKGQKFEYLTLILAKFYISQNMLDIFHTFYERQKMRATSNMISLYETQLLIFFEQLSPTQEVRLFFKTFVSDKHKQTTIYSKLNILYQISQKNVCSLDIFRRDDKHSYFDAILKQTLYRGDSEHENAVYNQNIYQFLLNKKLIKQTSFLRYLKIYLDYISYTCDKYQVSPENRLKAAVVYHEIFIKSKSVQNMKASQIVVQTIIHALKQCLRRKNTNSSQMNELPHMLFSIYDFLSILDAGTQADFFDFIKSIFDHPSLTLIYKRLFVLRVEQSNSLNMIRFQPKSTISRYDYYLKIDQWTLQKKKQLNLFNTRVTMQEIQSLPSDFQTDFAMQIILVTNLQLLRMNKIQKHDSLIAIYYRLLEKTRYQKIVYFLPNLYRSSAYYQLTNHFSKQIQNIFKSCIRDENIMKQFSFQLENELILNKFVYNQSHVITFEQLKQINNFLVNVYSTDLCLFEIILTKAWNKLRFIQYTFQCDLSFLYSQNGFIGRYLYSMKQKELKILKNKDFQHNCWEAIDFYQLLFFSKKFKQPIQKQISDILWNQDLWSGKLCIKCQKIRLIMMQLDKLHQSFMQFINYLNKRIDCPSTQEQIIQIFIKCYSFFEALIKDDETKIYDFGQQYLIERSLMYGQLLCSNNTEHQRMYSGVYNYFCFVEKRNMLYKYFEPENGIQLQCVLKLLKQKSIRQLAFGLYRFIEVITKNLMIKEYEKLKQQMMFIMRQMSIQQIEELFWSVKQIQYQRVKQNKSEASCASLIYICIFTKVQKEFLFHKTLALILRHIDQLHYSFKRFIMISLYGKYVNSTLKTTNQRQWLIYKNRLVKLLMINGLTVKRKRQKLKGNVFEKRLKIKMRKIQGCKLFNHKFIFSNK